MSTQAQPSGANPVAHPDQGHDHGHAHAHSQEPHVPALRVPLWLIVAYVLVIVVGAVLIFGRSSFTESAAFEAMRNCDAHVADIREPDDKGRNTIKPNGLSDRYCVMRINSERDRIAGLVSLCESDPAAGLRLFRRALNSADGNRSAKLVALYCADYLARAQTTAVPLTEKGVLEASDIDSIVALLDAKKEPELEVRKAALHALSDLVILTDPDAIKAVLEDPKAETRYTKISDAMLAAAKAALDVDAPKDPAKDESETPELDKRRELKIATHKETVRGQTVLLIRWSTPALALAWWNENAKKGGKWEPERQRFVFP